MPNEFMPKEASQDESPPSKIMPITPPQRVAVLGGSGLVGRALINTLLAESQLREIHLLLRREITDLPTDPRLQQHVVDFQNVSTWRALLAVDAVFCTLGSTIKRAGSQAAFRAVDYTLIVTAARATAEAGRSHFLLISALGADAHSAFFYNRVKGETEDAVRALPLTKLSIVRPSLLAGARAEFRFGENLALRLARWLPKPWRAIHADTVARALWRISCQQQAAVATYDSATLHQLGR